LGIKVTVWPLCLAGTSCLVVVVADLDAGLRDGLHHLGAEFVEIVQRRNGVVPPAGGDLVPQIARFHLVSIPGGLPGIDDVGGEVDVGSVGDRIEDVELKLRAPEALVGEVLLFQIAYGPGSNQTGVTVKDLLGVCLGDIADQAQSRRFPEGIEKNRGGIRDEHHVACLHGLKSRGAAAVERHPLRE